MPKVAFICGGDPQFNHNRIYIEDYFKKRLPWLHFRAEKAWEVIAKKGDDHNALAMEEWLASFSDVIIILVESFGTVAELGAFSSNEKLREKLLPILDIRFKDDESFINTGPVKWVNKDSKFKPSIYTDFNAILGCMSEVEKRLLKRRRFFSNTHNHNEENSIGKYKYSKKVFLFFILIILAGLGPITQSEVDSIVKKILADIENEIRDSETVLALSMGIALGIFNKKTINNEEYYYCIDYEKMFSSSSARSLLHYINKNRATSLGKLMYINEFNKALKEIESAA